MSELPDSWVVRALGEVNQFSSSTLNPATRPEEVFELYSVPSFPTGTPERLLGSAIGSTKQTVAPGDVLISKINPRINRVWTAGPKASEVQIASSEWIGFRSAAVQPAYANYYFRSPDFREAMCSEVAGVGGSLTRAQPKRVAEYTIPIAPAAEQIRIANQLDTLFTRIQSCNDRFDTIPALLKRFRQAVLNAATLGALTKSWREANGGDYEWKDGQLSDIAEVQGGVTKDAKKQSAQDEDVPYLRVANVQRGYIDLTEVKTIRVPSAKLEGLLLEAGDVLFNEGGDLDKLGRGWVWEGQIPRCTFQNHVFRARLFDKNNHPKFVSWWGNSRGLDYFIRSGKQTTNLASINKTMLAALPIRLPPAAEQFEIVRRVEALFAIADRIEARAIAARTQAQRLGPLVLAKAFRGELVSQDPEDEPVSKLLARMTSATAVVSKKTLKVSISKAVNMKYTPISTREEILKLPLGVYSFDRLRSLIPADYETLKDAIFLLLNEPSSGLKQAFDKAQNSIVFERSTE
ncbi:MAG: restriction endonuclease subunit S [Burkholderiaceae bacterium]|nr:restriction endonuclease subunit S [Burkholderiaceae bacterium]